MLSAMSLKPAFGEGAVVLLDAGGCALEAGGCALEAGGCALEAGGAAGLAFTVAFGVFRSVSMDAPDG